MKRTHSSGKLSVVRDALDIVLRRLAALPSSPEIEELRAKAEDFRKEAEAWTTTPVAADARERLMKQVLKLHVDVARLERQPR
jgi:hypothetical protein